MTKAKNDKAPESNPETTNDGADQFERLRQSLKAPETYSERGGDLVGFWDSELTPIHCIPRSVKLFDGNIDKDKPSILLTVELASPCGCRPPKDSEAGEEPFVAPVGSLVGVWYKPGMKAIRDLCGVKAFITESGEKDTGKPNRMKLYKVESEETGTRIPVTEDTRDESKPIHRNGKWLRLTHFDNVRGASQANGGKTMTDEEAEALFT